MNKAALEDLLRHPGIWRGRCPASLSDQRTGFKQLDQRLPGRGWPRKAMVELLSHHYGIGELQLLLPSLKKTAVCWIQPPYIPYAPALDQAGIDLQQLLLIQPRNTEDACWAINQVLRSGLYPQVLAWQEQCDMSMLRRLQLAAEQGGSRLFLFRPARFAKQASPAALRLYVEPAQDNLYLRILKCRGGQPDAFMLPLNPPDEIQTHDAVVVPAPAAPAAGRTASRAA